MGVGRVPLRRGRTPRRALAWAGLIAVLAVAGCSGGSEPFAGSAIAPVASPSDGGIPARATPIGSRVITGDGFTLAVPGGWEERRRVLPGSGEVARWAEPAQGAPPVTGVAVVTEDKPAESMLSQSYRLEQRLAAEGAAVVRSTMPRQDVPTPAILVQWQESSRGDGRHRTVWQLMVQDPGGRIINVVGYAPADQFLASAVPTVLGTLAVRS